MQMLSPAQLLAALPEPERKTKLAALSTETRAALLHHWRFWARPNQLAPDGDWLTWLVLAGRGFGKTRAATEWVRSIVCGPTPLAAGTHHRIAIVAETAADARDVLVEGESGILAVHPRDFRPLYEPSKRRLTWPNGAMATLYNGTEPDQLRGPQHDCFIAGTPVLTITGEKPIETISVGDLVLTRRGYRAVTGLRRRQAHVGTLRFSNNAELTVTATHRIYTHRGWVAASELKLGESVCAIDASSGAATSGINTATGVVRITNERISLSSQRKQDGFIAQYGHIITDGYRKASIFITSMAIKLIMTSPILNVYKRARTAVCTAKKPQSQNVTGRISRSFMSSVMAAVVGSNDGSIVGLRSALHVNRSEVTKAGNQSGHVYNAGRRSFPQPDIIVASVVSTWRQAVETSVYCLMVDQDHEYFANRILVHNCALVDEIAKYAYPRELWDMLQFGLRLGERPRTCITTTPRPIPLLREIMADPSTVITRGATKDNADNLAPSFLATVTERYGGTRLGRQELDGEILDDLPGALWTREMFDQHRRKTAPDMARVVVAIDPSGTRGAEDGGDIIGIVVAGKGVDGRAYVLADRSCKLSPDGWGKRAVAAYHEFGADRIVAERNFGGAMVEHVIRTVDRSVSYREVTASRGKVARAEPVAALYEQGRVSHIGALSNLEDQCCMMASDGYAGEGSPDRVDALVWALTELMLNVEGAPFGWYVGGKVIS